MPDQQRQRRARRRDARRQEALRSITYETDLQGKIREPRTTPSAEWKRTMTPGPPEAVENPVELFLTSVVDAGSYAKLFSSRGKLLEKSLAVLKLARDQLGIDGLTAPQISDILIKKFRVSSVYRQNVSSDLSKATQYVHRLKTGNEYKYL